MKVLILTSYAGSWPYIPEMVLKLDKSVIDVYILDIDNFVLFNPISGYEIKLKVNYRTIDIFKAFLVIRLIKKSKIDFDIINMHYIYSCYKYIALYCRIKNNIKTIATIWGSDFLRINNKKRRKLKLLFNNVDCISFNDDRIKQTFLGYYNDYDYKTRILNFGIGLLDKMQLISKESSLNDLKKHMGVPENLFIIALGYNAIKEQQHLCMIDALKKMDETLKKKCFVILQMTYPENKKYIELVKEKIAETNVLYTILDEKLPEEKVCYIRMISDIVVNIQITDSLSGSLQEHAFAGAKMIIGEWLKYKSFEDKNVDIEYIKKPEEISVLLEKYIRNNEIRQQYVFNNLIYELSSWDNNIRKWIETYMELCEK